MASNEKVVVNPDHIIKQTHTEVLNKRYEKNGTNGLFYGKEVDIRAEYLKMKEHRIPRTINILADKHGCHPTVIYRAIHKANSFDGKEFDLRAHFRRPPGRDEG